VSIAEQGRVRADVAAFQWYALEPAQIAPPVIEMAEQKARSGGLTVTARLASAESSPWNIWPDGTARLFNNRVAHVFEIELEGEGALGWMPRSTTLELNEPGVALVAAGGPDVLINDLLGLALQAERQLVDSQLVARTRAAGAFRRAYLPPAGVGQMSGVVAFPLWASDLTDQTALAEKHVVAMRLTLTVMDGDGARSVVMVFE
jgi:hypothetical protein